MKINKIYLLLGLIVFLGFFLRFYQLGTNPPSLTWDEAAWGYNAYSLGIDARDEFGRFLPLDYLESFGDFKPPVYAYLDIVPVKIFGLNEFATRFPSAFFGVLTVLLTYFLVKRIFREKHKSSIINHKSEAIALLSALFLAISPWHIMLSRAAFEANIATFFIVLGVWLFLLSVHGKRWILLFSVVSFVLSIYTFNTARVVTPILVLILTFAFRKELWQRKIETVLAIILGIILILPTLKFLMSPQASLRFKEVNIFSNIGIIENANKQIANDNNSIISKIIHNRRLAFSVEYLRHYFDNLNPDFLFIKGDGNPKFSTQNVGQLYLWEVPFFILGILYLIRKKEGYWWIVPVWLLIGIVPAGAARETPHALRIENSLPAFQLLSAYGGIAILGAISKMKYQIAKIHIKYLIFSAVILFLIFNFSYFLHDYLVHYSRQYSGEWQYGYKESIGFIESSVYNEYDLFYVTPELGRPNIYYLFYTAKNPEEFRETATIKRDVFGFVDVRGYDKFRFAKDIKQEDDRNILHIDLAESVPKNANVVKNFYLLNGQPILSAYTL